MWDERRFFELEPDSANGRLKWLQQQERVWFAWVCRLHDMHSGAPHSATVLAIAQRRWTEARRALERSREDAKDGRPTSETQASANSTAGR